MPPIGAMNGPDRRTLALAICSIVVATSLLAPAVGATRAPSPSRPRWGGEGSSVSGTIVTANAHELVVATRHGERVVLNLVSRSAGPRNGPSFATVAHGKAVTALVDVERSAAGPWPERMDLRPRGSSGPLILPIIGLLAIGTAGAVAIGRRKIPVFT